MALYLSCFLCLLSCIDFYLKKKNQNKKHTRSIGLTNEQRKENGSRRGILLALWTLGEFLCFTAQKLLRIAFGKGERWTSAAARNGACSQELSCIIHHKLFSLGSAGGSSQSSLSYTSIIFRGLKQAQASTAPTLSLHLQANVGKSAALLTQLRLFSLDNRSHATRGSYAEDTHVHSCWKMKLQVGECLVSRVSWLAVRYRNAAKSCKINMYIRAACQERLLQRLLVRVLHKRSLLI